ncbi:MAG: alpha/beta hydrolase [Caulobacteraceae bacterium]
MRSGLFPWLCGGALALASAALAQPISLQNNDGGPTATAAVPAVDPATVQGLPSARDYRPPEGIAFKATDFLSENVRLTAQWFYAAKNEGDNEGRKLPTVVMAHGWGATAANFREDAVELARAGYLVMLFDYRGWGDSDGRVMLTGARPATGGTFTSEVRELRGYVDPGEQSEDWFNAISYAVTQPMVDADRIGLRGSDLSGGYVVYAAAHDLRVKALVSQVTWADLRPSKPYQPDPAKVIAEADSAASRIAAGQAPYSADRARFPRVQGGSLVGAPVGNKLTRWTPVDEAGGVTQPALFVLAEKEELFSNVFNGQMACERVQGPRKMMILPRITHYGVYGAERARALDAAIDWFDRYLKAPGAPTRVPVNRREPERGACNPPPLPPAGEEKKDGSGQGHKAQATSGRVN